MHTYSYGVLLYSDGRIPPLVALFADLYQFCTRYVKSNTDLCSADVLTWRVLRATFIWTNQRTRFIIARNTRQVNTSAELTPVLLEHTSCKTDINRQITRPAVAYGHRNTAEHRRSMCACFLYSET